VRRRNRNTALTLLRGIVNLVIGLELSSAITFVIAAVSVVFPWST
jgi:hypothetical protein